MNPFTLALSLTCTAFGTPGAQDSYELALAEDAAITLDAHWEPVEEWAMAGPGVADHPRLLELAPAEATRTLKAPAFAPFLPTEPVSLGAVWQVDDEAIVALLSQFHPGAQARLHKSPVAIEGTWAALRAVGEEAFEIVTRSHAELRLEDGGFFTPGQFEGRLVLQRRTGEILSYRLFVPVRRSNLDVNVPTEQSRAMGANHGMAGIGRIPRMELLGQAPSEEPTWTESISDDEVRLALARKFYSAIDWLSFEEAVATAERDEKPLHVVVLLGAYDDESC